MFFDLKTIEVSEGYHDIVLPLTKITAKSDVLFQEVDLFLDTWTGEYLYDVTQGMPYDKMVLKNFDLGRLENLYFTKLSQLKYFDGMDQFSVVLQGDRELIISFCVISEANIKKTYSNVVLVDSQGVILTDPNAILTP